MTSYGQTWGTFLFAFLSLSVGAYEPATNYFSTSVEQADIGVTGETWTPIGWQTNQDSYRLERYRELDPTPYSENSRRSDSRFSAGSTNETYCSLLAGDQPLVHSVLTNQVTQDAEGWYTYSSVPTNAVTASSVVSASFQEATSARSSTPVADHRRRVEAVRERIRSRKDQP